MGNIPISDYVQRMTWETYLAKMSTSKCCGDHLTLIAISEAHSLQIVVLSSMEAPNNRFVTEIIPKSKEFHQSILICQFNDIFWSPLEPMESTSLSFSTISVPPSPLNKLITTSSYTDHQEDVDENGSNEEEPDANIDGGYLEQSFHGDSDQEEKEEEEEDKKSKRPVSPIKIITEVEEKQSGRSDSELLPKPKVRGTLRISRFQHGRLSSTDPLSSSSFKPIE